MSSPGSLLQSDDVLFAREDADGPVWVVKKGKHLLLTFGNGVVQSFFAPGIPHRLPHVYTQAMMLGLLLHPGVETALVLGLGCGSLVRALRHADANLLIDAVEYRQLVIDATMAFFALGEDERLAVHRADAKDFINKGRRQYDIIQMDLYLSEGAHPLQTDRSFLQQCRQHLSPQGILMVNQWCSEYRDSQIAKAAMQDAFGEGLLYLQVQGGNIVAFGFNGALPRIQPKPFFAAAQRLGNQLDIPLQALARNFWRQNAQPLRIGRYASAR